MATRREPPTDCMRCDAGTLSKDEVLITFIDIDNNMTFLRVTESGILCKLINSSELFLKLKLL